MVLPPWPLPVKPLVQPLLGKPQPVTDYFHACPPSGDGGDPVLNTLKNRIDEANWQPTTVADLLALSDSLLPVEPYVASGHGLVPEPRYAGR